MFLAMIWLALLMTFTSLSMGTILWGQVYGSHPFRGSRTRSLTFQNQIDWQSAFEVIMVIIMTMPLLMLIYGLLISFSNAQLLVDAGMLVITLLMIIAAMDNFWVCCRYFNSEVWPLARGRVYSLVNGDILPNNITVDLMNVKKDIIYVYTINGKSYVGYRVDAHNVFSRPVADRSTVRLIDSSEVLVYYHPDNPETALLVPGVDWSSVSVLLGAAVTCVLVPLMFRFFQM